MWKLFFWFWAFAAVVQVVWCDHSLLDITGVDDMDEIVKMTVCISYYPSVYPLPQAKLEASPASLWKVIHWSEAGCNYSTPLTPSSDVIQPFPFFDGNRSSIELKIITLNNKMSYCTTLEQNIWKARHLGAAGVFIVVAPNTPAIPLDTSKLIGANITVSVISTDTLYDVHELGVNLVLRQYAPLNNTFYVDFGLFVIWFLAMFSIILGTFSPKIITHLNSRPRRRANIGQVSLSAESELEKEARNARAVLNIIEHKKGLIVYRSYVFNITVLVVLVVCHISESIPNGSNFAFYFVGFFSLYKCLELVAATIGRKPVNNNPIQANVTMWVNVGITIVCLVVVYLWYSFEEENLIWIMDDVAGVAAAITFVRMNRPPNLLICIIFLLFMFLSDVAMLFVLPPKNLAVMMLPGDEIEETQPFSMMKFPRLTLDPYASCMPTLVYSGFSRVLFPGQLVAYCYHTFTSTKESVKIYFYLALAGFGFSLALTLFHSCFSDLFQPDFLYIVPCTLVPVIVASISRGEFSKLWEGYYDEIAVIDEKNSTRIPKNVQLPNSTQSPNVVGGTNLSSFQQQQQGAI